MTVQDAERKPGEIGAKRFSAGVRQIGERGALSTGGRRRKKVSGILAVQLLDERETVPDSLLRCVQAMDMPGNTDTDKHSRGTGT